MPPRRSSRAPSAAVEPPVEEILPGKRKRGQIPDPEPEEKENVAKPASRTTRRSSSARPSVAPPPKGRVASRSKVLPDVQESGDEEQEDEPPIKKSRPSVDAEAQEEEDEEEVQPAKGRKSTKGRGVKMEVEKEVPANPRSRRSSSRQAVNVSSGSRSSAAGSARSKIAPVEESAAEDDEEEEEKPKPARRGRAPAKPAARKPSKAKPISDDDESDAAAPPSDEEEEVKPARKGRKPKAAAAARKSRAPAKKAPKPAVVDDSDEDIEAPPSAQPRQAPMDVEAPAPSAPPQEEEEEKSLFDPPPMPAPSSLPTTMPEEPSGPKSRLVIHKMALVNFKSYAGRQEIGPFHKVSNAPVLEFLTYKVSFLQSFSSIVGPNGSGKSNTIDALLFVFGYRASKMRQAKVSELIHNSARYPDLDDCSVEVHFREILDLVSHL